MLRPTIGEPSRPIAVHFSPSFVSFRLSVYTCRCVAPGAKTVEKELLVHRLLVWFVYRRATRIGRSFSFVQSGKLDQNSTRHSGKRVCSTLLVSIIIMVSEREREELGRYLLGTRFILLLLLLVLLRCVNWSTHKERTDNCPFLLCVIVSRTQLVR